MYLVYGVLVRTWKLLTMWCSICSRDLHKTVWYEGGNSINIRRAGTISETENVDGIEL
jgi:hypothetical protein